MFTGIVREVGRVVGVEGDDDGLAVRVEAPHTATGLAVGDSVSVAGVCLTAEGVADGAIRFHAVPETPRAHDARPSRPRRQGERRAGAAGG